MQEIFIILMYVLVMFLLITNLNKKYNSDSVKFEYSEDDLSLFRIVIKPLRSLYITNRIIEANDYLTTLNNLINEEKLLPNQKKILNEDILVLKNLLISLNIFRGNQTEIIENILTKLK